MAVYTHLNGDHLLKDSCSYYSYTARTEDSTTLVKTLTYAAAVTTACMVQPQIGRRWEARFPADDLVDTCEIWLPEATAAKPRDKIVWNSVTYRIMDVGDWQGFKSALMKRIEGVT